MIDLSPKTQRPFSTSAFPSGGTAPVYSVPTPLPAHYCRRTAADALLPVHRCRAVFHAAFFDGFPTTSTVMIISTMPIGSAIRVGIAFTANIPANR